MKPCLTAVGALLGISLWCRVDAGSQLISGPGHLVPKFTGVNMNSATTDHQLTHIPWKKFFVRRVIIENCSISLGATSTATIGVFTAAGGTGVTLVSNAQIAGLTSPSKKVDLTVANTTDTLAVSSLFIRVGTAQGQTATCDVSIEASPLG